MFYGQKLELARNFRGLTQGVLANDVSASGALISYYENGKHSDPPRDLVDAWGEVLGFEPDFFFTPIRDPFRDEECSFRHRQSAPEHLKRRARAFGTLVGEVINGLKDKLELPVFDVPSKPVGTAAEIETAAQDCRARWALGRDTPIHNMGRVLENAGVPVVKTLASTEKVDAFSRRGNTSLVIVNTLKDSPSKWTFDMAHELGHLVGHRDQVTGSVENEREADSFASAFLLPAKAFSREFTSEPFSWEHLFQLKERWHVSLQAMIVRAYTLGLIDARKYRSAFKYISFRKWRRQEPMEPTAQEPELLAGSLVTLYEEMGEHPRKLCERLHFKPQTFKDVTGIDIPAQKSAPEVVAFSKRRN